MFWILEGSSPRYTDSIGGVLYVPEDRGLSPRTFPLQTDTIRLRWNNKLVDIFGASEIVLEGVVGKGQSHHIHNWIAYKIAFVIVEGELLPVIMSYGTHK